MALYKPETATFGSPQAMLPRFDENLFTVVSFGDMVNFVQNIVGSLGGGVVSGNYGGVAPAFTPTTVAEIAIDTSNGRPWWYYNGAWH